MDREPLISSIISGENYMTVWKCGQYNTGKALTHYISVSASYNHIKDCYSIRICQEPYGNNKKGTKIINFIAKRADLDGLLKIAKIKGGMEL